MSSKVGVVDKGDEGGMVEGGVTKACATPCCFCGDEWRDATKTAAANANFILPVDYLYYYQRYILLLSNGILVLEASYLMVSCYTPYLLQRRRIVFMRE